MKQLHLAAYFFANVFFLSTNTYAYDNSVEHFGYGCPGTGHNMLYRQGNQITGLGVISDTSGNIIKFDIPFTTTISQQANIPGGDLLHYKRSGAYYDSTTGIISCNYSGSGDAFTLILQVAPGGQVILQSRIGIEIEWEKSP